MVPSSAVLWAPAVLFFFVTCLIEIAALCYRNVFVIFVTWTALLWCFRVWSGHLGIEPGCRRGYLRGHFDCALVELAGIQKKPIDRLPSKRCSSLIPRFLRAWSKHTLYLMYVVCRPGLVILWVRFSAAFRTSLRFIGSVRKLVNHTSHSFCAMGWCARVLAVYSSCLRMCSACSAARFYEAFRS